MRSSLLLPTVAPRVQAQAARHEDLVRLISSLPKSNTSRKKFGAASASGDALSAADTQGGGGGGPH